VHLDRAACQSPGNHAGSEGADQERSRALPSEVADLAQDLRGFPRIQPIRQRRCVLLGAARQLGRNPGLITAAAHPVQFAAEIAEVVHQRAMLLGGLAGQLAARLTGQIAGLPDRLVLDLNGPLRRGLGHFTDRLLALLGRLRGVVGHRSGLVRVALVAVTALRTVCRRRVLRVLRIAHRSSKRTW
jgi:hypothetical protein